MPITYYAIPKQIIVFLKQPLLSIAIRLSGYFELNRETLGSVLKKKESKEKEKPPDTEKERARG